MKRSTLYEIMLERSSSRFCSQTQRHHLFKRVAMICEAKKNHHQGIKQSLSRFISELQRKWQKVGRSHKNLCSRNKLWLEGNITIIIKSHSVGKTHNRGRGRPAKSFNECSDRSKRRRTARLREKMDVELMQFATQMKLRAAGKIDAAKVSKDVSLSPGKARKYREGLKNYDSTIPQVPVEKALAMMLEAGLSKNQYELIKSVTKECGCDVFPSYNKIKETKEKCFPPVTEISETKGQLNLQDILNHTAERIMCCQEEVFENRNFSSKELIMISKWGCDGTNGSMYKQKFEKETDTDEYIFLTSFVPLELKTEDNIIIWHNPRPSSPRFCRPLKLEFVHETAEVTVNEVRRVENEIRNLVSTVYNGFKITHRLIFSMIDGKVCNAVTSTKSSQKCYLCSLTSKNFNDLEKVRQTKINEETTRFGLSTLHAWIRIFENILHLSYKLGIRKWQARYPDEKQQVAEQKTKIQKEFKIRLGLVVDRPKQSYGNSNDGNTARRFFENSVISSEITGININLINRCHVILQAISCGHSINVKQFQAYTSETANLYVNLYQWYPMSTTMHKILMHSATVTESCIVPIGMLSEEAQEARNKHVRNYREHFARKSSRKRNMEDVIKRLLVSSDPLISSVFIKRNKSTKKYSNELINLLEI